MSEQETIDGITIKQLCWKPGICRDIMCAIAASFLRDRIQWSDNVDLKWVSEPNRNCIGTSWRNLIKLEIIQWMECVPKRSEGAKTKGRRVMRYRLTSEPRLRKFLSVNGWKKKISSSRPCRWFL